MNNTIQALKTQNLALRTFIEEDAEVVQQFLAVNKSHMIPWIPWAKNEPESVETKRDKILKWKEAFEQNHKYIYGVYEKGSTTLIGMTFMFTRRGKGSLEIGYILDFRYSGKGYATEASAALTQLGFSVGAQRMLIYCDEANAASARIPAKLGYQHIDSEIEKTEKIEKKVMIWEKTVSQNELL